jgi:hypothetical protein
MRLRMQLGDDRLHLRALAGLGRRLLHPHGVTSTLVGVEVARLDDEQAGNPDSARWRRYTDLRT